MANQNPSIHLCGYKPRPSDDPCGAPAVFAYVWEWGETGVCCAEHAATLQQIAGNLGRRVTLTALATQPEAPLQRGERVQLIAEKLAAEAELEEVKKAGADLYNDNVRLTQQVQSLTTRKTALELQVRDFEGKTAKLEAALQESEAVQGDQLQELERLRVLVKFANPSEPAPAPAPAIG